MMEAACDSSPAVTTMTTRSAVLISARRSLVRPVRSLSHPAIENGALLRVAPSKAEAVRKVAPFHLRLARCFTTASLGWSSAITFTARGFELGALMRKRASAADDMRADSLSMGRLRCFLALPEPLGDQIVACATPGCTRSASLAASLNGWSGGSTTEAERTF